MSPIPLSILAGVFIVWLTGTVLVLVVLLADAERSVAEDDAGEHRHSSSRR